MKKYYCIINSGVVVNKIVANSIEEIVYPFAHTHIVEDVNRNVMIGSLYNIETGVFTLIGNPIEEEIIE